MASNSGSAALTCTESSVPTNRSTQAMARASNSYKHACLKHSILPLRANELPWLRLRHYSWSRPVKRNSRRSASTAIVRIPAHPSLSELAWEAIKKLADGENAADAEERQHAERGNFSSLTRTVHPNQSADPISYGAARRWLIVTGK